MNKKAIVAVVIAAAVVAGTWAVAQAPKAGAVQSASDPRIDKLLQQNEEILKNQQEILKQLEEVRTAVGGLRRRLS